VNVGCIPTKTLVGSACVAYTARQAAAFSVLIDSPVTVDMARVNARGAFTHTSYNDFEIVAANLLDGDKRRVSDRIPCYGLFIDPPLGRVGKTEREVRASGRKALIGRRPMTRVGRAREFGETRGFMKVLVDAQTEELLGASILGINGDEVVHSLLDAIYASSKGSSGAWTGAAYGPRSRTQTWEIPLAEGIG